ncbi:MAG: MNIO family bufferin maturase [Methylophilaceae bacterium]
MKQPQQPQIQEKTVLPNLGFGLGLRTDHYHEILETKPNVDWFEALSENYMVPGGKPLYFLDKIRADYPMVMHGVSLSIGSTTAFEQKYLIDLKNLADRIQPAWISDHLCWTGVHGQNIHDLLPLPYTEETVKHVVERVNIVQDFLGRQLLLENVSSYASYIDSTMTEWEFIHEIAERADCLLLLDVNNIYVSSFNHNFEPKAFVDGVPAKRVQQIHLAGHHNHGDYIIDTHDALVIEPVWDLYRYAISKFGAVSTMIERDDNIPVLSDLVGELQIARNITADLIKP